MKIKPFHLQFRILFQRILLVKFFSGIVNVLRGYRSQWQEIGQSKNPRNRRQASYKIECIQQNSSFLFVCSLFVCQFACLLVCSSARVNSGENLFFLFKNFNPLMKEKNKRRKKRFKKTSKKVDKILFYLNWASCGFAFAFSY